MPLDSLPIEPVSVRIPEAVRLTGISRSVLYEMIKARQLETAKLGRTTLIPYAALRRLVQQHTTRAA